MKILLRLTSVILSISLAISVFSFASPGRTASAAVAGESQIAISAGSSNPAVIPEARPSEENAAEDGINTEPGDSLSGHVYQADGVTPVSDAQVIIRPADSGNYFDSSNTSEDGSYAFRDIPPGNYRVEARATGYIAEYYAGTREYDLATPVSVTAFNNTLNIDFTLDPGGTIFGYIFQADGTTPVKGARVHTSPADGDMLNSGVSGLTASDGSYTISDLPTGSYWVEAHKSDYLDNYYCGPGGYSSAAPVFVTAPEDTPDINISLDTGGTISGYVYQSDGVTPINGVSLQAIVLTANGNRTGYGDGVTAADGSYTISALPAEKYRIRAEEPGYITEYYRDNYDFYSASLVAVTGQNNITDIDFTLDTGGSISGHIFQSDGITPLHGASVFASLQEGEYHPAYSYTDANGAYTITALPSGNYIVGAGYADYLYKYYNDTYNSQSAMPVQVISTNDTPDININLDTGGSISGHIYQADGATPATGVRVEIQPVKDEFAFRSTITASDGSYSLRRLSSGRYIVRVQPEGYPVQYYSGAFDIHFATMVNVIASHDTPGINITLDAGGSISGHVYQADGATPVSEAEVSAFRMVNRDEWVKSTFKTQTAEDGSYTIHGLSPGDYLVSVRSEGYITEYYGDVYQKSETTPVNVTITISASGIDFNLDTGATISGHVYQSDGVTPIAYARVGVPMADIDYVITSSDGSYTLQGLPSGSYQVFANSYGYVSEYYDNAYYSGQASLVIVTAQEATVDIDFTLDKGGSISGHVYQVDGVTPVISGIYVSAIPIASGTRPPNVGISLTSHPGNLLNNYMVQQLPPGDYRVFISASGYLPEYYDGAFSLEETTLVTVVSSANTPDIDFTLDTGGGISGHVYRADGATPIWGAVVYARPAGSGSDEEIQTSTDPHGSYSFSGLPSGSYKIHVLAEGYAGEYYNDVYLSEEAAPVSVTVPDNTPGIDFSLEKRGDANKDGKVNMGDVTRVELIILGLAESTPLADANGDGKINMGDVTRIELDILGL